MLQNENDDNLTNEKKRIVRLSLKTVNYVLIIVSIAVAIWFSLKVFLYPLQGPRIGNFIPVMISFAVLTACSFAILKRYIQERKYQNLASILQGFLMLVLPFMMIANLNKAADRKGISILSRSTAPLINALDHYTANTFHPPVDIADMLTHIKYGRPISYYYGKKEYLIAFRGGSIDIDGTTIFYTSKHRQWNLVHNDELLEKTPMGPIAKIFKTTINSMFVNRYKLNNQTGKWEKSKNE